MEADEAEGEIEDVDETVAETCPPEEEPASTHVVRSPRPYGRSSKPGDPVRLSTGEKVESAVDLVIPLSGKDFRLVRNYRSLGPEVEKDGSTPTAFDGLTGGGHVGNHWDLRSRCGSMRNSRATAHRRESTCTPRAAPWIFGCIQIVPGLGPLAEPEDAAIYRRCISGHRPEW